MKVSPFNVHDKYNKVNRPALNLSLRIVLVAIKNVVFNFLRLEERTETREVELDWFDRDEDDIAAEVEMLNVGTYKEVGPPSLEFSSSVFPYDFWFLLSGFIAPEDVGRFASISPLTRHIVSSQAFWRRLYSRYFSPG